MKAKLYRSSESCCCEYLTEKVSQPLQVLVSTSS